LHPWFRATANGIVYGTTCDELKSTLNVRKDYLLESKQVDYWLFSVQRLITTFFTNMFTNQNNGF